MHICSSQMLSKGLLRPGVMGQGRLCPGFQSTLSWAVAGGTGGDGEGSRDTSPSVCQEETAPGAAFATCAAAVHGWRGQ